MKKIINWVLAATLVCSAMTLTACSNEDNNVEKALTAEKIAGLWVADYDDSGTEDDLTWTRVVEDYLFNADGTGYYECYLLYDNKVIGGETVRDNGIHYIISGNTVKITDDKTGEKWALTYAGGKLIDETKCVFQNATAAQQTLVNQLYADYLVVVCQ